MSQSTRKLAKTDSESVSKANKYALVALASCGAAYVVYQCYKNRQQQDTKTKQTPGLQPMSEWTYATPRGSEHGSERSSPYKASSISLLSEAPSEFMTPFPVHKPVRYTQSKSTPKIDLDPQFLRESAYRETVIFLLAFAANRIFPDQQLIVRNTFQFGTRRRSYFCRFASNMKVNESMISKLESEMKALSAMELDVDSKYVDHAQCLSLLTKTNQQLSAKLVLSLNRPMYKMVGATVESDGSTYFMLQYRSLLNNTRYASRFALHISHDDEVHFVVKFPHSEQPTDNPQNLKDATHGEHEWRQPTAIRELYQQGRAMSKFLDIQSVSDVNDIIHHGRFKELVLVSEAYHNRQIVNIATEIQRKGSALRAAAGAASKSKGIKLILISGPSSSGKTTFASKLAIQLRLIGKQPTVLEVDMFYKDRKDPTHPRDSKGHLNFEVIDALKIGELNDAVQHLLDGKAVKVPTFDFKVGARSGFSKEALRLDPQNGVLIMEGIFCLNPVLLSRVKDIEDISFKVFICPISPFYALDNFHFISEQVIRLIRRVSRDHFHRGSEAENTVFKWGQLKEGEDINIFPYIKHANAVFNSALLYELCVLKVYSKPLLQTVTADSESYHDAQNLVAFLDMFFSMPDRSVPNDSLLMEFIGTSIFDEI